MTGRFLLDWAILGLSWFNTVLLLWLGLTVLLNAERRTLGVWLTGGGLLAGGAFFVVHSALLGAGPSYSGPRLEEWWQAGWLLVVMLPLVWYGVMLWYAGYWEDPRAPLRRRHRIWFVVCLVTGAGLFGLLLFANPLPHFARMAQLDFSGALTLGGAPLILAAYGVYIVLCVALSLDALSRPGPSRRVMGELARRRARPWLIGAGLALLAVSLLVAGIVTWLIHEVRGQSPRPAVTVAALLLFGVAWFDLAIEALIGLSILLLGQAVISYEVFTGHVLPRQGFQRDWRRAVILAGGYGALVGAAITLRLGSLYSLLLTALLMVAFFALLSWRSYAERERTIEMLRPFVASERLYEHLLLSAPEASAAEQGAPFRSLCQDVLEAEVAYLIPLGPLAPLAGPGLAHPEGANAPAVSSDEMRALIARLSGAPAAAQAEVQGAVRLLFVPLDPACFAGAAWAVPLWGVRGLIGVLLLGPKRAAGVYTREEIEIARDSGERLLDAQASTALAGRLMALQRQRLAESQVADRRTRRTLHDEILPRLHAALLALSSGQPDERGDAAMPASGAATPSAGAAALLAQTHRHIADLLREMPAAGVPEVARLGLAGALRQVVEDELKGAFDEVTWRVDDRAAQAPLRGQAAAAEAAGAISLLAAEVLFYAAREALRNAARHARPSGGAEPPDRPLHVRVTLAQQGGLTITIEDDGVGFSPAGHAGGPGGQGLALHGTMMAVVGGTLEIESEPGRGTRVVLALPGEYGRGEPL